MRKGRGVCVCVCVLFSLTLLYIVIQIILEVILGILIISHIHKTWVYISPPSSWGRLSKILTLFILTFILLISLKFYACFFSFLFFFIFFIFEFIFVRKSGAAHPTVRVCYTYKFFSIDNNRKSIYTVFLVRRVRFPQIVAGLTENPHGFVNMH